MVDNTVTIVGNLTADPEIRVTDGGATLQKLESHKIKEKETLMDPGKREIRCFFKEQFGTIWQKTRLLHYKKE